MRKLNPAHSRQHALRYVKRIIKSLDVQNVSYEMFYAASETDCTNVNTAFQMIIFNSCDTRLTSSQIDEALRKYRRLCFSAEEPQTREYNTYQFYSLNSTENLPDTHISLYNTASFIHCFFNQIYTDFYLCLTKISADKTDILSSIKLLYDSFKHEREWMEMIELKCYRLFGKSKTLTKQQFHHVLEYQGCFSDRIFDYFTQNCSIKTVLTIQELKHGLLKLLTSNNEVKLHYLFYISDADGNGVLSKRELRTVLSQCVHESSLELHADITADLVNMVWKNTSSNDKITFNDFHTTLRKYPDIYNSLSVDVTGHEQFGKVFRFMNISENSWKSRFASNLAGIRNQLKSRFTSNLPLVILTILYIVISIVLVTIRSLEMSDTPYEQYWFIIAKCAGKLLNFNIPLALFFTLKYTTRLRRFRIARILFPFNDTLFLHKMLAYITTILAFIHTISHICFIVVNVHGDHLHNSYFYSQSNALPFWSGILLVLLIIGLVILSRSCVRTYSFELFVRGHQLSAVLFLGGMMVHGSSFWMWVILPLTLAVIERLYFIINMMRNKTNIIQAVTHGNLTKLTIRKPTGFKYSAGDYVNINIPQISKSQWHPFTVSSSPYSNQDTFTLHIRKVGVWTTELYEKIKALQGSDNKAFQADEFTDDSAAQYSAVDPFSDLGARKPNSFEHRRHSHAGITDRLNSINQELELTANRPRRMSRTQIFRNLVVANPALDSNTTLQQMSHENQLLNGIEYIEQRSSTESINRENHQPSQEEKIVGRSHDLNGNEIIIDETQSKPSNQNRKRRILGMPAPYRTSQIEFDGMNSQLKVSRDQKLYRPMKSRNSSYVKKRVGSLKEDSLKECGVVVEPRAAERYRRSQNRKQMSTIGFDNKVRLDWKVYLDGPFSTPSFDILKSKHAILVAGGIGVTPFTSVLESVISLLKYQKQQSNNVEPWSKNTLSKSLHKIETVKRIDFFWVTRDQSHLALFHRIFCEIEKSQQELGIEPIVHLHIYLTKLNAGEDVRGAFLQLALDMAYQEDNFCTLSGLKAKTRAGRPIWSQVLKDIRASASATLETDKLKSKVYACGPQTMCDQLKKECVKQDIGFSEEVF